MFDVFLLAVPLGSGVHSVQHTLVMSLNLKCYEYEIINPITCNCPNTDMLSTNMDVRFWWSFFSAFSLCDNCVLKSTTAWLLKLSVLYSHSFMQVHNTTFQIKTVFNNVLFSTEVHNPLHAHLLALSRI